VLKIKRGFTLTETALVMAVSAFIGFVAFGQLVKNEEYKKAQFAGEQIKVLGNALNAYISNHYDTLSSLTNSTGNSSDVGPRTCSSATNTCSVTHQTLINDGLLPSTYSGKNVYGSGYNILLKREGSSPYYQIHGMVVTNEPLKTTNVNIRYDLLGNAMLSAGIDSGMTRDSSSLVSGFNGGWSATSADYSNINKSGLLAYQAGYGTYNYSVFLRRDGTLPMTGNLNMGANSINNAANYNGTGNITTGGKVVAGGEVSAKNGYGDTITIGGDASSNDYEIRLGSGKPLTIYSPNAAANSTVLYVGGNTATSGKLATVGLDPNDIPTGWGGGIRTFDVIASGTIALIKNGTSAPSGNLAAYMNLNGDIYSSNTVNTSGTMYAQNGISTGGSMSASGNVSGNGIYGNYVHSNGNVDAATDVNAGRQVNAQYVWASGNLNSNYVHSNGNIDANGRVNSGEFVYINGQANIGWGCSPNGLVGRTPEGTLVSCVNGIWKGGLSTVRRYYGSNVAFRWPHAYASCPAGQTLVSGGGNCVSNDGRGWAVMVGNRAANDNTWEVFCDTPEKQYLTAEVWAGCM